MQQTAVVGSKAVVFIIFVISLVGQILVIPGIAAETAAQFPEVEFLTVPGIIGCVAIVACVQVSLVCIWLLLSMVASSRIFQPSAYILVNIIIGSGIAVTLLFLAAVVVLDRAAALSPGVLIVCVVGAVGGAGLTLLVIVMKGLLHKATQLEQDMAEVV